MLSPLRSRRCEHLAHDDVEEGEPLLDLQQRLGAGHAHAGAEAAVQLEYDNAREGLVAALRQLGGVGQVLERLDLGLRQRALLPLAQAPLVLREGLDRDLRQPLPAHLLHRRAHRPDPMRVASAP